MKKKLLYLLSLTVIMLCCITAASAADEKSPLIEQRPYKESENIRIIDNVVYKLYEGNEYKELGKKFYEVYDWFATPEAAKTATEINIVPEIDGIKVKAIQLYDASYFSPLYNSQIEHNYSVKKITIPDTIVYIGNGIFPILDGLEELVIPSSVKAIGYYEAINFFDDFDGFYSEPDDKIIRTFQRMESLKKVTFSGNINIIGGFEDCPNLEQVIFKGSVKYFSDRAFLNCSSIKKIKIPETVIQIGGSAFAGSGITSITIPASVKWVYGNDTGPVFENCKKLAKIVFADRKADLFVIDNSTFRNCTALKKVYLPKSVKKIYIEASAFRGCKNLTKVYNTGNIVKIGANAFRGCKALTSFTISSKVTEIGKTAFYGCTKLKKVTVNSSKKAPAIGKKAFVKTAKSIKFVAKNSTAAKSWKSAVKKSGLKNMKVCYVKYVNV